MISEKEKKYALRMMDANLNRAAEGLRVCEDITRFALNNKGLQAGFKSLRHKVKALKVRLNKITDLINARDSISDVGRESKASDMGRKGFKSLFAANAQRCKESLRSLEEVSKMFDPAVSEGFKDIRFRLYTLEKESFSKFINIS